MDSVRRKLKWIWKSARQRCYNPNNKDYKNYGGRGITMSCDWERFSKFYEDMSPSYKEGLSLERVDVNGNYCKENCTWINLKAQSLNKTQYSSNKSGITGISWKKRDRVWIVTKRVLGKNYWIGQSTCLDKASKMLEEWEKQDWVISLLQNRVDTFL